MTITAMVPIETLRRRAADGMRRYRATEGAERTLAAKETAEALMAARTTFQSRDGSPDLLGRSGDYRAFLALAQEEAGIPKAERSSIMAAIRYHISSLLRERYGDAAEVLELSPGSSVERARRRKARDARVLAAFGKGEAETAAELSLIANTARQGVSRVAGWPRGTTAAKRATIRAEFENLADAVAGALDRLQ